MPAEAEMLAMATEVAEKVTARRGLRVLRTPRGLLFLDEDGHEAKSR